MENKIKIRWDELKIGDKFPDGSVVTEIKPWEYKKCFKLIMGGKSIVVSDTHLLLCEIRCEEEKMINYFKELPMSRASRILAGISEHDTDWICAQDIFDCFNDNDHQCKIYMGKSESSNQTSLDSIELYKNGEPQRVRCITTNRGSYTINGFVSHNCGSSQVTEQQHGSSIIMATLDGWGTSPIIQKMREVETTEERRQILYEGLKNLYKEAGLKQDEFNLQMVARKLTSYKRENGSLRPINPGECCDIVSIATTGSSNNIFKISELSNGYNNLTKPIEQKIKKDAANQILR